MPLTSIAREELLALHKELGSSEYVFVNSKTLQRVISRTTLKYIGDRPSRSAREGQTKFHYENCKRVNRNGKLTWQMT